METTIENLREQYGPKIEGFVFNRIGNQADAEDIIQNIYLSLFQSLSKFRRESDIGTYIYAITECRLADFLRRKYRDRELLESALSEKENLSKKDFAIRRRMMFISRLLSPREMEVFKLVSRGFTNLEIAKELHIDNETVRSHIKQIYVATNIKDRPRLVLLGVVFFGAEQNLEDIFSRETENII